MSDLERIDTCTNSVKLLIRKRMSIDVILHGTWVTLAGIPRSLQALLSTDNPLGPTEPIGFPCNGGCKHMHASDCKFGAISQDSEILMYFSSSKKLR